MSFFRTEIEFCVKLIFLPLLCHSLHKKTNFFKLSPPVSEPLTNRGVLLSTLLQDILYLSHHLLNVLLQIANKMGLSNKNKTYRLLLTVK
jgi:hypothetical protein